MLKRIALLCATVMIVVVTSCIFDPGKDDPKPPVDPYPDLTQKNHVLQYLEQSYNDRQINKYQNVLDQGFTMFFSPGDVSDGKTPEQWGRAEEVDANRNLFNVNWQDPDGLQPRCLKITLDVKWEDGVQWQQINPQSAPTETWYTATVFYNFDFFVEPDLHLVNSGGSKAQFTVRNAGTDAEPHWQLVELRDLAGEV